jgi:hypothetical protein
MGHLCIVSVSRKRDNSCYGRGSVHQSSEKCLKLSKAWWAHSCALCIQVIFNRHQTAHYKPSIHDSTFKHCVLHMSNHVKPYGALSVGSVCRDKPPRCWYVAQSNFELGLFRYSRTHGPSANLQRKHHCWCPPQLPWLICKVSVVCQSGTPFKILKYCAFPSLRSKTCK